MGAFLINEKSISFYKFDRKMVLIMWAVMIKQESKKNSFSKTNVYKIFVKFDTKMEKKL